MPDADFDWASIKLVAFDVDGTLYAQRPLRLRMGAALAADALMRRDRSALAILRTYRREREALADAETEGFEAALVSLVARRHNADPDHVGRIVVEWIERRPLKQLLRCRYAGVERLFDRIRQSGRRIGVLSDYPAHDKLAALHLAADDVVCAADVGVLKPHPRGLQRLIDMAGVTAAETVLIGDRAERDGEVARRAGTRCLLRSDKPVQGWRSFSRFDDPLFDGLDQARLAAAA